MFSLQYVHLSCMYMALCVVIIQHMEVTGSAVQCTTIPRTCGSVLQVSVALWSWWFVLRVLVVRVFVMQRKNEI